MALREFVLITGFLFVQLRFSDGIQCYWCDSSTDEYCATLELSPSERQCDGNCAIWIVGTTTYRGCQNDVPDEIDHFISCATPECNKIIFPDDRIKCVKCSANDSFCTTPDADLLYPCKNYVENDSCYTYVIDETSAIRGCLSDQDTDVDLCNSVDETCITCSEEFCNLQNGKSYVMCVTCSSEADGFCGYSQDEESASTKLCEAILGRENLCFAYSNQTHSIRGCLNDFPELKPSCFENSETCQICDEDSCNDMKIIEELCYVCDSMLDPFCENAGENLTPTLCGEGPLNKSGCYLSDKGGVIKRGCVTSLDDDEVEECQDGDVCKICHGEMCNIKASFQRCFTCDSQDDPNCATLKGELEEKLCDDYLDSCKVYVKPNMTTVRGCFNEMLGDGIECSPQSVNCKQCPEPNCNGEIFPANRLSCYHCEGPNSDHECYEDVEENVEFSHPCETYNFRDSCFLHKADNNMVHRGCLSDPSAELCLDDPDKCKICQAPDCNSESVMKAPELSCVTCDTANSESCNWGWRTSFAEKCKKERFFYEEETCYVLKFSDQTIRGCTLDGNVCRTSSRCDLCKGDACNQYNTAHQSCYQCTSDEDNNCTLEPFHTKNVTCDGLVEYDHRGCYTWIDSDKKVKRGCYSDFTTDERIACDNDDDNCERCVDQDNCNDQPKGSAKHLTVNLMFFTLIVVLGLSGSRFTTIE